MTTNMATNTITIVVELVAQNAHTLRSKLFPLCLDISQTTLHDC
jgi:hypothetical protein